MTPTGSGPLPGLRMSREWCRIMEMLPGGDLPGKVFIFCLTCNVDDKFLCSYFCYIFFLCPVLFHFFWRVLGVAIRKIKLIAIFFVLFIIVIINNNNNN